MKYGIGEISEAEPYGVFQTRVTGGLCTEKKVNKSGFGS